MVIELLKTHIKTMWIMLSHFKQLQCMQLGDGTFCVIGKLYRCMASVAMKLMSILENFNFLANSSFCYLAASSFLFLY